MTAVDVAVDRALLRRLLTHAREQGWRREAESIPDRWTWTGPKTGRVEVDDYASQWGIAADQADGSDGWRVGDQAVDAVQDVVDLLVYARLLPAEWSSAHPAHLIPGITIISDRSLA